MKKIIRKVFNLMGYDLIRTKEATKRSESIQKDVKPITNGIKNESFDTTRPLDPEMHLALATKAFSNNDWVFAWAELKTAQFLGLPIVSFQNFSSEFREKLPNVEEMNHNLYFRLKSLSSEILDRIPKGGTVLDVGGGNGILASFIPDLNYCLAEPMSNGINGLDLPFNDESFDLVVSCHVFEHIPFDDRELFLDQLVSKSKVGVVLLNPIHVEDTLPEERMQLVIDVMDADWAKEHKECTLPKVEDLKKYADSKGLAFHYKPNGTVTTSLAMVFFQYLSSNLNPKDVVTINRFFNTKYLEILNSERVPNAGIFFLEK